MWLGPESYCQLTARKKMGPQSYNHKELKFINNLNELGREFSTPEKTTVLASPFISVLHNTEPRTQLGHALKSDLQKL